VQKKKPKSPLYAKRKKAFDSVMDTYRGARGLAIGVGAVSLGTGGGRGTSNPARPSIADFRCDVDRVIIEVVADHMLHQFYAAYTYYDAEDPIETDVFAQKILGRDACNVFAQRIGAVFLSHGISPMHGKGGYFTCERRTR
jgi:hypothetical protein